MLFINLQKTMDQYPSGFSATNFKRRFLDFKKGNLSIGKQQITWNGKGLNTNEFIGIRYGMLQSGVNGMKSSRSYQVHLSDGRRKMRITFSGLSFRGDIKNKDEIYIHTIVALWQFVMKRMINDWIDELNKGGTVEIAGCQLSQRGLSLNTSRFFIKKEVFASWVDCNRRIDNGSLIL